MHQIANFCNLQVYFDEAYTTFDAIFFGNIPL